MSVDYRERVVNGCPIEDSGEVATYCVFDLINLTAPAQLFQ